MLTALGTSLWGYDAGAAFMLAECSLYNLFVRLLSIARGGHGRIDLTVFALPHEICLAPATADFVDFKAAN